MGRTRRRRAFVCIEFTEQAGVYNPEIDGLNADGFFTEPSLTKILNDMLSHASVQRWIQGIEVVMIQDVNNAP